MSGITYRCRYIISPRESPRTPWGLLRRRRTSSSGHFKCVADATGRCEVAIQNAARMRCILNCNFAAARRLRIIFLGRPYSTYVKCPYVRGREIWDWVEAVLEILETPPKKG